MAEDKLVTRLVLEGIGTFVAGVSRVEHSLERAAVAAGDLQAKNETLNRAAGQLMQIGAIVTGIGAAMAGALAIATKGAIEEEAVFNRLRRVYGAGAESVIEYAQATQLATRFSEEEIAAAAMLGATFPKLKANMEASLHTAMNMSVVYGMDLTSAMRNLGRASGGFLMMLGRMGILTKQEMQSGLSYEELLVRINEKTNDAAFGSRSAATALAIMSRATDEVGDAIGSVYIPLVKAAAEATTAFAKRFLELPDAKKVFVAVAIGAIALTTVLGGLALSFGGMALASGLATMAVGAYVGALVFEAGAAGLAAGANVALAAARLTAAGAAGVAALGIATLASSFLLLGSVVAGTLLAALALPGAKKAIAAIKEQKDELDAMQAAAKLAAENQEALQAATSRIVIAEIGVRLGLTTPDAVNQERANAIAIIAQQYAALTEEEQKGAKGVQLQLSYWQQVEAVVQSAIAEQKNWTSQLKLEAQIDLKTGDLSEYSRKMDDLAGAYFDQATTLEQQGRHFEALGAFAEALNTQEERRKTLLDQQNQLIQKQLGYYDARVGFAQAYADYLEASGQRGLARRVRQFDVPFYQRQAAAGAWWAGQQAFARGDETQGLQLITQSLRYNTEAFQPGGQKSVGGGRSFEPMPGTMSSIPKVGESRIERRGTVVLEPVGGLSRLTITPNWSFDRMQKDQDATVSMRAAAGIN